MTASRVLARGRTAAAGLMVDTCTIDRPGELTLNEETGTDEPTLTTVYEGKCRVQASDTVPMSAEVGGREATFLRLTVSIPMDADPVLVDDQVTITEAALDAQLVGRIFRVTGVLGKTHATARRLDVQEVL